MQTVLLVDDNEDIRFLIGATLEAEGFRVLRCEGALEALDRLQNAHIDAAILDIMMPEINGLELLRRIRADRETREIPVLMLSALDETARRVEALEMGADDFLVKPANGEELVARVKRLTMRGGQAQIEGALDSMSLAHVLQNLSESKQTGILVISTDAEERSRIFFSEGMIIGARSGKLEKWDAMYQILGLTTGRFRFSEVDPTREINPLETNIHLHTSLLDLAYFEDELRRRHLLVPRHEQQLKTGRNPSSALKEQFQTLPMQEVFEAVAFGTATSIGAMIEQGIAAPIRLSLCVAVLIESRILDVVGGSDSDTADIEAPKFTSEPHQLGDSIARLLDQNSRDAQGASSLHILVLVQKEAWAELYELLTEIPEEFLSVSRDRLLDQLNKLKRGTIKLRSEDGEIILNLQLLNMKKHNQGHALVDIVAAVMIWLADGEEPSRFRELIRQFNQAPCFTHGLMISGTGNREDVASEPGIELWNFQTEPPSSLERMMTLLSP